jgi:hypothetical protein
VNGWTIVSYEDRHLMEHFWSMDGFGYVRRRLSGGGQIRIHREIMELPSSGRRGVHGPVVDHINRDRLDNRRENLRVCTQGQNAQNRSGWTNGSSRFRGVSFQTSSGKWYAYGRLEGKMVGLGLYQEEDEAAAVARMFRQAHMPYATD